MYKPLPEQVTIKKSKIHGLGLFAVSDIPKGTILGMTHFKHVDYENGWLRTPLGGFYNHSNVPNCNLVDDYFGFAEYKNSSKSLCTLRDIFLGEELTCSYTLYKIDDTIQKEESTNDWLGL